MKYLLLLLALIASAQEQRPMTTEEAEVMHAAVAAKTGKPYPPPTELTVCQVWENSKPAVCE